MVKLQSSGDADGEVFSEFILDRRILIADPSSVARTSLYRILIELGTRPHQISMVNSFVQAVDEIARFKPHVVVAEFDLGGRCGIDLLQGQREAQPKEIRNCLFIIVASNTSQSAVARAAEEDVDAYIVKPYTQNVVRKTLVRAAMLKVRPSEYSKTVERGKLKTADRQLDEAEGIFQYAMKLDQTPTLACYYLGQVKEIRQQCEQAKGVYNQGLTFNKIHYKCNLGLYDLFLKEKNYEEAYEVIQCISHYFPNNPKRLSEVLRLAIINSRYEDVEKYYAAFCSMDDREESLIKHVCAALIVCGKYYLRSDQKDRAVQMFQKATATGTGRGRVIREVIQALVEHNAPKEARMFLSKFSGESHGTDEFAISRFLVLDGEGDLEQIIAEGRTLVSKGVADEYVYSIMIRRSCEARLETAAESLFDAALRKFPLKKRDFEDLYRAARNQSSAA